MGVGAGRDLTARNEADLLGLTGAKDRIQFGMMVDEDAEYDASVAFEPAEIELRMGLSGLVLEYPFSLNELWDLIGEMERTSRTRSPAPPQCGPPSLRGRRRILGTSTGSSGTLVGRTMSRVKRSTDPIDSVLDHILPLLRIQ